MQKHRSFLLSFPICLILSACMFLIISTVYMKIGVKDRVETLRTSQFNQEKQLLKSYVSNAYETIQFYYYQSNDQEYLKKYYGTRLKITLDLVKLIIELKKEQNNEKNIIKEIRYLDAGDIWIINADITKKQKILMHSTMPILEGLSIESIELKKILGEESSQLFAKAVEYSHKEREHFFTYLWPWPVAGGQFIEKPKFFYVRYFPQQNWTVGIGIPFQEIIHNDVEKSKEQLREVKYEKVDNFWIADLIKNEFIIQNHSKEIDNGLKDTCDTQSETLKNAVIAVIKACGRDLKSNDSPSLEDCQVCDTVSHQNNIDEGRYQVKCHREFSHDYYYCYEYKMSDGKEDGYRKISYARVLGEPLNWVIGVDSHLNLAKKIEQKVRQSEQDIKKIIYPIIIIFIGFALFGFLLIYLVTHTFSQGNQESKITKTIKPMKGEESEWEQDKPDIL